MTAGGQLRYAVPAFVLEGEAPMMTGPGDEIAAGTAGRGRLRASHAEREQAIEVLKAAFVQGRLTKDEFDARAGQALTARTCADLAAVTAGFPAGPAASRPPGKPARMKAPPSGSTELKTGVRVIIATTVLTAGAWVGAWFARAHEGAARHAGIHIHPRLAGDADPDRDRGGRVAPSEAFRRAAAAAASPRRGRQDIPAPGIRPGRAAPADRSR